MAIERWNGTRYESVDLARFGASTVPLHGWVYAPTGSTRRMVFSRPRITPVAYQATSHGSITRNVWTNLRTWTIVGSGTTRLSLSWTWAAASATSHTRSIRVTVDNMLVKTWSWTGTTASWSTPADLDLTLREGAVVRIDALANSATTAARNLQTFTSQADPQWVPSPRPTARLWMPMNGASGLHAGITRPSVTYENTLPEWRVNQAARLNGGRIVVPASAASTSTGFSYALWVRTLSSGTGWRTILWQAPTGSANPETYVVFNMTTATTGLFVTGHRMGTKVVEYSNGGAYNSGNWYHLVVIWERTSTTAWTRRLMVDGRLVAEDASTAWPTTPLVAGNPIRIGSPEWYGDVDDFGYWDYPLSHAEVGALYFNKDLSDFVGV